ncbi:hypothetical protein [Ideonella sp.]|jgi:hypothetical protein|uniref:hypothetical protein n=1 Tax=Ideonella sp. TaxID=1929293 RepID=UPI0037BE96AA
MSPALEQFLNTNASAIFGLLGALGGGVLSFVASLILKRRELNYQLRSKLVDRQIAAHECVLSLAQEMRVMVSSGRFDQSGEVERGPNVLQSKEAFEAWFTHFTEEQVVGSSWLTTGAKREVALVQDYLITLHLHLADVPSERYPEFATLIRQDFIDLSSSLERAVFLFFEKGIHRARPDSPSASHKYPRHVTESRLSQTTLLRRLGVSSNSNAEIQ